MDIMYGIIFVSASHLSILHKRERGKFSHIVSLNLCLFLLKSRHDNLLPNYMGIWVYPYTYIHRCMWSCNVCAYIMTIKATFSSGLARALSFPNVLQVDGNGDGNASGKGSLMNECSEV